MPSTYSENLRLEKIASGAQANTWGNTTNTNIATLLEQAITGITELNVTAGNKVLTALNGAYDQARSMTLIATGTPGATRTISSPAGVAKVYVVSNATDANVIIQTTASGPPLGVTVPSGASKFVYTDGTDFFECTNASEFFTADTVSITGTPTDPTDAVTLDYVDTSFYPLAGGTVGGPITSTGDISVAGSGAVLRFADGTTQSTAAAASSPSVPSGSVMLFYNASAPSGWTQNITQNDKALRVVSSVGGTTGGSVAFSTAFASQPVTGSVSLSGLSVAGSVQSHTLTSTELPNHAHTIPNVITTGGGNNWVGNGPSFGIGGATNVDGGGGAGHSHGFSGSVTGSASFTGNAINLAVQYLDLILCTKN
jgi:hypothetical protein